MEYRILINWKSSVESASILMINRLLDFVQEIKKKKV